MKKGKNEGQQAYRISRRVKLHRIKLQCRYGLVMDTRYICIRIIHIHFYLPFPNGIEFHRIVNAQLLLVELKPLYVFAIRMYSSFLISMK